MGAPYLSSISKEIKVEKTYESVIGLEVHVELLTASKIFCSCSTKFGQKPNSQICPVCTGMPGSLPLLNKKVVEYAVAVGLALGCKIRSKSIFDRKHYFYPDNPQNYQITQFYHPVCYDGRVKIETKEREKSIGIHQIHMEEDAGKLVHGEDKRTYIDYNRSGIPLLEIVTEPDMRNEKEVVAFLEKLRSILLYLEVSDCDLSQGSMRVDVNLSVRKHGQKELGSRTEMKNLNSFRAISKAIEAEKTRQITLLESGKKVLEESRRFVEKEGISYAMRSKEDSRDYRYFPEPDLPPVFIEKAWEDEIRKGLPEFQEEKIRRYQNDFGLSAYEAKIITGQKKLAEFFEETLKTAFYPKSLAKWMLGDFLRLLNKENKKVDELSLLPKDLACLMELLEKREINREGAKQIFELLFLKGGNPREYAEKLGLFMGNDLIDTDSLVEEVLKENPKPVKDYLNGKEAALSFLVGQGMKKSAGKINPIDLKVLFLSKLKEK